MSIPSVEKIHIYQEFGLDRSLLAESFVDLTIRPDPLNLEEAKRLEIETTLRIARARELSRGSSNIQLNGPELRLVIQRAFDLEEESFADFFVGNSFGSFMRTLLIFSVVILRRLIRRRNHNRSIPPPAPLVLANRRSERLVNVGSVCFQ